MANPEFEIPVRGIRAFIKDKMLLLQSQEKLVTLNSSILGGGFHTPHYIANYQVDKGYDGSDPVADLKNALLDLQLPPESCVGMMTAARIADAAVEHEGDGDISVTVITTAGISNAMSAGGTPPSYYSLNGPGTINIILLIDGNLTPGAMANAVITATEAKTMAMQALHIKDVFTGEPASGTSTDAVVVAITGKGSSTPYAGTATPVGGMIGRTVRKAVTLSLERYLKQKAAEKPV